MTGHAEESSQDVSRDARRDEIVEGALRLLDRVGFEKLSVRGVAQALGMHAPGIYWYLESKQELIDRMAAAILAEGYSRIRAIDPTLPWGLWMEAVAVHLRETLFRHRDGARVVASAYLFRTHALTPWIETMLERLEASGFEAHEAAVGTFTMFQYTVSTALDEQHSPPLPPLSGKTCQESRDVASDHREGSASPPRIDPEEWPRTATALRTMFHPSMRANGSMHQHQFMTGLRLILAGMRQQLTSLQSHDVHA